jgi:hypothetical protein
MYTRSLQDARVTADIHHGDTEGTEIRNEYFTAECAETAEKDTGC